MTLTFGHVCIAVVFLQFLESFDVRTKRTAFAKTVSKFVRSLRKTLLMYVLVLQVILIDLGASNTIWLHIYGAT
jgi:hypothetical protein